MLFPFSLRNLICLVTDTVLRKLGHLIRCRAPESSKGKNSSLIFLAPFRDARPPAVLGTPAHCPLPWGPLTPRPLPGPSTTRLHTPLPSVLTPRVSPSPVRRGSCRRTQTATLCPSGRYPGSRRAGALCPLMPVASPGCATCTR